LRNRSISIEMHRGTREELLNEIVEHEPGYTWEERDGVVNVFPRAHVDTVLDIRIARFHVRNAGYSEIHAAIVAQPEVKEWLERNKLTERTPAPIDILIGKNGSDLPRISLELRDVTLREIMNAIIRSAGFRFWSVGRWGEKDEYLAIGVS
jgi:hypothetical protein